MALLSLVIGMVLFGLIMVYSSSYIFATERTGDGFIFIRKQTWFALAGVLALIFSASTDYLVWRKWAYPALAVATVLLGLVLVPGIGITAGGARRWLALGPLHFQPAELAKFALVFFVAMQIDKKFLRLHKLTSGVLANFIAPLPALVMLLFQPDFGSFAVMIVATVCLMFLGGVPLRYLFLCGIIGAAAFGALIWNEPYRVLRLMTFLDPWQDPSGRGFQILQSLVGINNGGIFGVGLGNGKEKLFFLPEAHNDFIFSVIGEELGFAGLIAIILAFSYFLYRGFMIGWTCYRRSGDRFGMLLAVGITVLLGLQGFINMAVVMGVFPTKGLALPFISYGGSALLIDLFAVGVLLSISRGHSPRMVRSR